MQLAFTRDRPTGPFLLVDHDAPAVRRALGSRCFGPNWITSRCFRGENLNMARSAIADVAGHDLDWWQVHVRGWTRDDGMALRAHFEPDPQAHPSEHIDGQGYSAEEGMYALEQALVQTEVGIRERVDQLTDL